MNVVLISGSFPPMRCGIGDYTARLAGALAQDNPQLRVTVLTGQTASIDLIAADPAKVHPAPLRWGFRSLPRILSILRRLRPDLVHMQYPALGYANRPAVLFLPLLIRLVGRRPVLVTIHEFRERGGIGRLATLLIAWTANAILVPDAIEAASLRRELRWWAPPITPIGMVSTIPVAEHVDLAAWRARFEIAEGEAVIATFGLIHPRRRLEVLIDAVQLLRQQGTAVRLLIIGGEAAYDPVVARSYTAELQRRIEASGLDDHVQWLGFVEAEGVSALLQLCTCCVLLYPNGASQRNTTLMAALDHGVSVITTSGAATPPELRSRPDITFLDAATLTAAALAEACLQASAQLPVAEESPRLREHLAQHRRIYRQLLAPPSGENEVRE